MSPIVLLAACGPLTPSEAEDRLRAAVEDAEEEDDVHAAVLRVEARGLGVDGAWSAGASGDRAFTPEDPFLSASVGKLFTATAVLALAERGALSLDDRLEDRVGRDDWAGLPVEGGDDALASVTVRQLLGHRSGLPDYFEGETSDGAPNVLELLAEDPDRAWTREALLDYTRAHFEPAGAPGGGFCYSDVNYDLLGLALEGAAGAPWHEVVRSEVIDPLGLTATWAYNLEDPPEGAGGWAEAWVDEVEVSGAAALSLDGAGGGLATTTADLHRLMDGLRAGTPVALSAFQEEWTEDAITRGIDYGYGLWRIRPRRLTFGLSGLPDLVGVSGATGSFVYWEAEREATISGTFNQTNWADQHVNFLLSDVSPVLERVEE